LLVAAEDAERLEEFADLIRDEVNVKRLELTSDVGAHGEFQITVNARDAGLLLCKYVQDVIRAVKAGEWRTSPSGGVEAAGIEMLEGEYTRRLVSKDPGAAAELPGGSGLVVLDTRVTPELAAEGVARDLVRIVQQARRDAGLDVTDRIVLTVDAPDEVLEAARARDVRRGRDARARGRLRSGGGRRGGHGGRGREGEGGGGEGVVARAGPAGVPYIVRYSRSRPEARMPASASAAPQRRRLLVMAAGAAACAACAAGDGGGAPGVFDIHLPPPTVLVSLESELIGHPTDIDVDAGGRVWVADTRNRRLLVVDPAGGEPRLIDREGEGPGEFRAPARLAIADTLVHVV